LKNNELVNFAIKYRFQHVHLISVFPSRFEGFLFKLEDISLKIPKGRYGCATHKHEMHPLHNSHHPQKHKPRHASQQLDELIINNQTSCLYGEDKIQNAGRQNLDFDLATNTSSTATW